MTSPIEHRPYVGSATEKYPAGQRIDTHWHDEDQLIYVSSGLMAVHTEHGAWVASPRRAVLVPAGIEHEHRVYGHTQLHVVGFEPGGTRLPSVGPGVIAVDSLLHEVLIAVTDDSLGVNEQRSLRRVMLDRLRRSSLAGLQVPTPHDPRLVDACRLVLDDLSHPRSLVELARHASVSERTLARLFRSEFALTYPQWRTNARIYQAMIELAGGASVTETAHRCGYATTSAFVDSFRRTMGRTPGQFGRDEPVAVLRQDLAELRKPDA